MSHALLKVLKLKVTASLHLSGARIGLGDWSGLLLFKIHVARRIATKNARPLRGPGAAPFIPTLIHCRSFVYSGKECAKQEAFQAKRRRPPRYGPAGPPRRALVPAFPESISVADRVQFAAGYSWADGLVTYCFPVNYDRSILKVEVFFQRGLNGALRAGLLVVDRPIRTYTCTAEAPSRGRSVCEGRPLRYKKRPAPPRDRALRSPKR